MTTQSIPTESLQTAAIQYAVKGWVVFPVGGSDGKRPLVKYGDLEPGEQHIKDVMSWWHPWAKRTRDANIGLRTGRYGDASLVVIDIDPRHGGHADPNWPETLTASTPSGGTHHFYSSSTRVGNSVSEVAPGVDVRGMGGYVVVPPSPGREWISRAPIARLPVLPCCGGHLATRRSSTRRPMFEPADVVLEGGRNNYLAREFGWLLSQGLSLIDAEEMLYDRNLTVCSPPLPDEEVATIVASIGRRKAR